VTTGFERDKGLPLPVAERTGWDTVDVRAVDTVRLLAAGAVQKAGNGHPGSTMSLAPETHLLFQNVMRHDPMDQRTYRPASPPTASTCRPATRRAGTPPAG